MPELDPWPTTPEVYEYLNTKQGKPLKDYLYDKLSLREAALKSFRHYYLGLADKQPYYLQKVTDVLFAIAIDLSDSLKQRKIVKFLVVLRNLRFIRTTRNLNLGTRVVTDLKNGPYLSSVLFELGPTICKATNGEYF